MDLAGERPGMLVVVAERWMGATRFATEIAERLTRDGQVLVRPRGDGTLAERLGAGLVAEDLRADPVTSSQLLPFVAFVGDLDDADAVDEAWRIGEALAGTRGLVVACAREIPTGPAFVELDALGETESRAVVLDVAPRIRELPMSRVLRVAAGRPGVLVPLARVNRRPASDDEPLQIPPALLRVVDPVLEALDPDQLDILRWAVVLGARFDPALLVRLTGRAESGLAPILDGLVLQGLLREEVGTEGVGQEIADPLVAEIIRQETPPSELRRRNVAVLGARRARGDSADELVPYAIGSADPGEVIALSLRASSLSRARNDGARAVEHAERALTWIGRSGSDEDFLEAMLEKGLAQATAGEWADANQTLNDVVRRQRRAGNEGAAIAAAIEWARVRWFAGYRPEAFEILTANMPESDEPLKERAEALQLGAMFATLAGRHSQALDWAEQSRDEALALGDVAVGVRALNAVVLAKIASSANPTHLTEFRTALAEAQAVDNHRQAALTYTNESASMLMMGMAQQAADRAQLGLDLVEARQVAELDAPLTHNLAEALTLLGRFAQARRVMGRSRAAFTALGARSLAHLDGLAAWLDFVQGKIPEALQAFRTIAMDIDDNLTIEHMGLLSAGHAHVAHAAGEIEEAREIARTAVAYWGETEDLVDSMSLFGAACEVLPPAEAKPVRAELQRAADGGAPIAQGLVHYADGWMAKSAAASIEAFHRAADTFAEAGLAWWAARSRMLAGERAAKTAGIEDLLDARRMFRELEAPGWRAKCEAELRARGHKFVMASRKRDEAGLSTREVEVLEQVALGLTNREIADRLYISEKTAGRHLERIYAKLGVSTRTAAVSAAVDRGLVTEVAAQMVEASSGGSGALSDVNEATIATRM